MSEKKKILLVDDVLLFLEQEKSFLDRDGFDIFYARSGNDALQLAEELAPDLVLMDFYLPDMNGDHCCRQLKRKPGLRETPVVMITAGVYEEDFEKSWQAGCNEIIVKPINANYFRAVVRKYLPVTERQAPRYFARLRVHYGLDGELLLDDYSINLSTGGLFLESARVLAVDTSLSLSFTLPEGKSTIRCAGRVAWINHPQMIKVPNLPPGMGIQFLDLSLEGLAEIRDFIKTGALLPSW